MDTSDVYPDVLGEALSYSSQRLAQLGSLVTAGSTVQARRKAAAKRRGSCPERASAQRATGSGTCRMAAGKGWLGTGTRLPVARPGRSAPGSPYLECCRGVCRC
jgi:hypothetical protein